MSEFISIHPKYADERVCLCGNSSVWAGFIMCDEDGNEVSSDSPVLDTGLWACERCGRVVKYATLEVIGQRLPSFRLVRLP
jgi:hypothetical protein